MSRPVSGRIGDALRRGRAVVVRVWAVVVRWGRLRWRPVVLLMLWIGLGVDGVAALLAAAGTNPGWWVWGLGVAHLLRGLVRRSRVARRDVPGPIGVAVAGGKPASTEALAAVARHEAAHAVAALTGGGMVRRAHVIPRGGLNGQVIGSAPDDWPVQDALWLGLVTAVAGNLVDLEASVFNEGSTNDWVRAWSMASAIASCGVRPVGYEAGELQPGPIIDAARARAAATITSHGPWIARIADALMAEGELTGEQISALRSEGLGETAAVGHGPRPASR